MALQHGVISNISQKVFREKDHAIFFIYCNHAISAISVIILLSFILLANIFTE